MRMKISIAAVLVSIFILTGTAALADYSAFSQTSSMSKIAKQYCKNQNVAEVYEFRNVVKVVSSLPGSGSTYYFPNSITFQCPVVYPQSSVCQYLNDLNWRLVCQNSAELQ
jgi:hypothetical protein